MRWRTSESVLFPVSLLRSLEGKRDGEIEREADTPNMPIPSDGQRGGGSSEREKEQLGLPLMPRRCGNLRRRGAVSEKEKAHVDIPIEPYMRACAAACMCPRAQCTRERGYTYRSVCVCIAHTCTPIYNTIRSQALHTRRCVREPLLLFFFLSSLASARVHPVRRRAGSPSRENTRRD